MRGRGGACVAGGMHGQGVRMAWGGDVCGRGGMCGWGGMHSGGVHGGHAWQGGGGHTWLGVCLGVCVAGGHAWGACVTRTPLPPPPPQILRLRHTVNERAVRILLECILVCKGCSILTIHN